MANNDKRLNYFNGQFLQDSDFKTEQAYHVDRQRRHNRLMHTFGIAEGLAVNALAGASTVGVTPGTAIDGQGQQIVLFDPRTLQLGPQQTQFLNKNVLVVLSYAEGPSDPAQVGGSGNTRTWENPNVQIVVDDGTAPAPDVALRLARLKVDNGGLVSGALDLSVRVNAGARVGSEVDVPILKLQTAGVDASQWPAFTSNVAGEADLAGSLVVSGDIKVGSAPQTVAVHIADKTSNPHAVTAAQIGAPTSVGGISNPGGAIGVAASGGVTFSPDNFNKRLVFTSNAPASISGISNPGADIAMVAGNTGLAVVGDPANHRVLFTPNAPATVGGVSNPAGDIALLTGGAIVVTADAVNKRITISENHSANTSNPHLTTATQVGAITGVGGVTNPGGVVNLATGGAIVLTADNTSNKRITISENHSTVTGNPHGTLAAQLSDYDFGRKSVVGAYFSQADADGATRTLNLGFQPRFLWISGGCSVYTAVGYYMGGNVAGFGDLRSGINTFSNTINVTRLGSAPYVAINGNTTSYLGYLYFYDGTVTPIQYIYYYASITSVTATGFVVTFNRYTPSGGTYASPSNFYLNLNLACVG